MQNASLYGSVDGGNATFICALARNVNSSEKDFTERDVQRHVDAWKDQCHVHNCNISWVGNDLVVVTDSVELARLCESKEQEYVLWTIGGVVGHEPDSNNDEAFTPLVPAA